MDKNDATTKEYYSNKNISNFYKTVWGGECIHVGIYDLNENTSISEHKIESFDSTESIKHLIKTTIRNKCDIMYKLIRMYNYNNNYNIADFGSGFGGTARFIVESFNNNSTNTRNNNIVHYYHIDCYDISKDNCHVNTTKTLKSIVYDKIKIYNRSFTDTLAKNNYYDFVISEDAFIHIDDKNDIFKEINRVLNKNGLLIFSDIIRTENANKKDIEEVCNRIGVSGIISDKEYLDLANKHGLKICNQIEYNEDMIKHYKNIKIIAEKTLDKNNNNEDFIKDYNKIINGLDNWIKHIELGNITIKIYIFTKI